VFKNTFFFQRNKGFLHKLTQVALQIATPFLWRPLKSMKMQKRGVLLFQGLKSADNALLDRFMQFEQGPNPIKRFTAVIYGFSQ
jgi:hypothetical protein